MGEEIFLLSIQEILQRHPYVQEFFVSMGWKDINRDIILGKFIEQLSEDELEDCGMEKPQIRRHFFMFMEQMDKLKKQPEKNEIHSITILGGQNKSKEKEGISLVMRPGDIICIVGPTGSGKSRLLGDIECLAQKDTPTGRQILINEEVPAAEKRFSIENKLVAQLSQNMNFVMDLTVGEFVAMHAQSRMIEKVDEIVDAIVSCANELAGETFAIHSPVTQLSGGQSRALMIADTALLSASPIVLIDEIENAGVDRKKALDLLVKKEKIVLMSTHDPILALMGHKRIVIRNGGIYKIIETSVEERNNVSELYALDEKMLQLRNMLRMGKTIDFDVKQFFYQ